LENFIHTTEIIGYIASVLVAISLMMSGIIKLRVINLIGAILFFVYGLVIDAYPIALVNGIICFVNIYYLYDIFKVQEYFKILEVEQNSEYLNYFLKFHETEIRKYIPSFTFARDKECNVFFILRNSISAGLIYAEKRNDGSLFIELDYVIPGYRDLKIGKYVYKNIFKLTGAEKLFSYPGNKKHEKYLKKMGFLEVSSGDRVVYCLEKGEMGDLSRKL
jgi:hypothetical protein